MRPCNDFAAFLRARTAKTGTQTYSLCAQRSCTPLSKRSGQNVRWAHRTQPCVPFTHAPADGLGAARQSLALPFAIAASEFGRATLCGANVVFAAGMITNMFL